MNGTKALLDMIISWEKDLSEYQSLESILKEQFVIFEYPDKPSGIVLIARERQDQLEIHGRTIERDVKENDDHQLVHAASLLCTPNPIHSDMDEDAEVPAGWDENHFERMLNKDYKQRLIIAGALIAAEIDRIQAEEE